MFTPIFTTILAIDVIGIAVGLVSISMMFNLKKSLGGKIGGALNLVIWGVSANILAFGWTIVFTRLKLYPAPAIDVHHLLMTIGMILFVLAARKLSTLIQL